MAKAHTAPGFAGDAPFLSTQTGDRAKKKEEEEDNPFTNEVQVVETKKEVVIPTKADLFKEWIKAEKVTKKVVATKEAKVLYESYVKYLTAKEVDVKDKQLVYSYGGGVFGKALKNYYPE